MNQTIPRGREGVITAGIASRWLYSFLLVSLVCLLLSVKAHAFTVVVVDEAGAPISGFKWLLEEDNTHDARPGEHLIPGVDDALPNEAGSQNTQALDLHRSHAPVLNSGASATDSASITALSGGALPDGRYFLSVISYGTADTTYDMGGTSVLIQGGVATKVGGIEPSAPDTATIKLRANPIETAQISVKVFNDVLPLNNALDIGEAGLAGFTITIGDQGGDIVADAFGNLLGTTYQRDVNGDIIFNPDGTPAIDVLGTGDYVTTCALPDCMGPDDGLIFIKNLAPGKYAVQVEPPAGGPTWHQVTTIEGTKTIDAWVRPNEPAFLAEFGPPITHVFYGFTQNLNRLSDAAIFPPPQNSTTLTGTIKKTHSTRPPGLTSSVGDSLGTSPCIVGLNTISAAAGQGDSVYVDECAGDGSFSIPGVPDGTFQLVVFDRFLDVIIYFQTVIVNNEGTLALGDVPVKMWFGEQDHYVFSDNNQNGFRDAGEIGIPEMNINLRFRDGTIYAAFPTDSEGAVPFEEIFPWFRWQVAEVDFARLKATGLTTVVDNGGPVTNDAFGEGKRNPIINTATGMPYFTEAGPVLTQGYQQFADQNTRFEWGKAPYDTGDTNAVNNPVDWWNELQNWPNGTGDNDTCNAEADSCTSPAAGDGVYDNNGGISGVIFYATTRAEDDPRFAAGEEWEPGVARVQVNLYRDNIDNTTGLPTPFGDGLPDRRLVDACGAAAATCYPWTPVYADVDNHPQGNFPGPEDLDRNTDGVFDQGDALDIAYSDSWDDNIPTDCVGNADAVGVDVHGVSIPISECADGLRTWNQARPALFDGGYAFGPQDANLAPGTYIVEAATPAGYKQVKEEDRNVDFGTTPVPALLPAECIGDLHEVPPYFTFATQNSDGQAPLMPWASPAADFAAPFAGEMRPLCDRKRVDLSGGQNSAADFFLFTDVPRAARAVGMITDDLANEASPGKPTFSEKFAPGWMPISWRDYTGKEIVRSYSDEFGAYNTLLPSTYAIDLPTPSGVGPKMAQLCLNDPGPIPNPDYDGAPGGGVDAQGDLEFIDDPFWQDRYSTTCYNFQFEAGRVSYLDTPVIRVAAFTGPLQSTLDCEHPDGTPLIQQAIGSLGYGPYVGGDGDTLQLLSVGALDVPNPDYPGDADMDGLPDDPPLAQRLVSRDYGFGTTEGQVCVTPLGGAEFCFDPADVAWTDSAITISIPTGAVAAGLASGQLMVKHSSGAQSEIGITLTVGAPGGTIRRVMAGESIQDAIDLSGTGDLILIDPGLFDELVIMNKKVKLQGSGAGTVIRARHFSGGTGLSNPLDTWRTNINQAVGAGVIGMVGNQPDLNPLFADGEGPGIFVSPPNPFAGPDRARIDGMTIRNGDIGGGIYANTNARGLQISNLRMETNLGNFGGAIRVGNPTQAVLLGEAQTAVPEGSTNENMRIVHNQIINNGSNRNGGGIAIFKGARNYRVTDNLICGNFARSGGGGISHFGLSDKGRIENNTIAFNESFQGQELGGGGGGIEIAGDLPMEPALLTEGSGDVHVHANLIQGNLAGVADGGGLALNRTSGLDLGSGDRWTIRIYDNFIVNNATGLAGAGISLSDAVDVFIIHNTIAHNDSTASAAAAFENGNTLPSVPQPAGVVSRVHSGALAAAPSGPWAFSRPRQFRKNIVWHNRTFFYDAAQATNGVGGLVPRAAIDGGPYWDLAVLGTGNPADLLDPRQSILSDTTGYHGSNLDLDPLFIASYANTLQAATAADEGGNFVQFFFTPLGVTGDYHITNSSPAFDAAGTAFSGGILSEDIDGDARPSADRPGRVDIGADEVAP